jgi:hypothetical protein
MRIDRQRQELFILTERFPLGGAGRDRTDDILLAKQALSQLSYGPNTKGANTQNGGPGRT